VSDRGSTDFKCDAPDGDSRARTPFDLAALMTVLMSSSGPLLSVQIVKAVSELRVDEERCEAF
jgi:hypothetical protein